MAVFNRIGKIKSLTAKPAMNKNMPKQISAVALKIWPEKLIAPLVQGYSIDDIRLMIKIGKSHLSSAKSANKYITKVSKMVIKQAPMNMSTFKFYAVVNSVPVFVIFISLQ